MKAAEWAEIFAIVNKYAAQRARPVEDRPISCAEHDIVYLELNTEECPEDSEDGKRLREIGCCIEHGSWGVFV